MKAVNQLLPFPSGSRGALDEEVLTMSADKEFEELWAEGISCEELRRQMYTFIKSLPWEEKQKEMSVMQANKRSTKVTEKDVFVEFTGENFETLWDSSVSGEEFFQRIYKAH